jgi:HK97 family phage prohead protease
MKHDFSGISTAYEVKCGDGRTIAKGAFDHQDQTAAPLVWRHQHQDMQNVLGHGVLLASEDGMRYQAKFNNSPNGRHAKQLVKDGDIRYLSIYANRLKVDDRDPNRVVHGMIREVSLVLAGENPGAVIEDVIIHGDGFEPDVIEQDAYIIHSGIPIELLHEEEEKPPAKEEPKSKEEDLGDILATFDQNQEVLFSTLLHAAASGSGKLDPEVAVEKDGPTLSKFTKVWTRNRKIPYICYWARPWKNLSRKKSNTKQEMISQ